MSQTKNKSAYGIFSSIKVTFKRYREKIEPNLQLMIIIGMGCLWPGFLCNGCKRKYKRGDLIK